MRGSLKSNLCQVQLIIDKSHIWLGNLSNVEYAKLLSQRLAYISKYEADQKIVIK